MEMQDNLADALESTVRDTDLKDITIDLAEVAVDSFLKDDLLKEIPIISTIVRLSKFSVSVRDYLFIKKLIHFFFELRNVPVQKRQDIISKIDQEKKYRTKVGEKLLFLIDKCDDQIAAEYVAKFFKAFIEEKITYNEFLRCSYIIQKIFIDDFHYFLTKAELEIKIPKMEYMDDADTNLINAGLCGSYVSEITIEDQWDYKSRDKYIVDGGNTYVYITEIGKKVLEILKP